MSGRRVLALYSALLFGFAVVLCRLYLLAQNSAYAARADAQSTVKLSLPARRGNFYDCSGNLLTGLEPGYLALCFPGENSYARLYGSTDSAGQALLYRYRAGQAAYRNGGGAYPAGQRSGRRAADNLPPGAAGGGSSGGRNDDQRLYSGSGYRNCGGPRMRQRAGI